MSNFLPENYEVPSNGGNYMKLEQGDNVFRILDNPIMGWEDWKDDKPLRYHMNSKPDAPVNPERAIKHFWAMVVWNVKTEQIQILEITQSGIQKTIKNYVEDEDWGDPTAYDIKINREGEKLDTKYTVTAKPHKPLAEEVQKLFSDTKVNLNALYTGDDPFAGKQGADDDIEFPAEEEVQGF